MLSRPYILKLFKDCLPQSLLSSLCLISFCFLNNWSFLSRVLLSYHQCDAEEGTGDFDKVLFVNLWSNFEGKVLVLVPDTLRQMKGKTLRNKFPNTEFFGPVFPVFALNTKIYWVNLLGLLSKISVRNSTKRPLFKITSLDNDDINRIYIIKSYITWNIQCQCFQAIDQAIMRL